MLQCKEPTIFEYVPAPLPGDAFGAPVVLDESFSPSFEDSPEKAPIVLDFNGDGRDDLLFAIGYPGRTAGQDGTEGGQWASLLGRDALDDVNVSALGLAQPRLAAFAVNSSLPDVDPIPRDFGPVGDYNGDGFADAFNVAVPNQLGNVAEALLGNSAGFQMTDLGRPNDRLTLPAAAQGSYTFFDFDGDGLHDFLHYDAEQGVTFWRQGLVDGTFKEEEQAFSGKIESTLDIDGDGRVEPLHRVKDIIIGNKQFDWQTTETLRPSEIPYFDETVRDSGGHVIAQHTRVDLDINGDGLSDLLVRKGYQGSLNVLRPVTKAAPVAIRFNTGFGVQGESTVGVGTMTLAEFASIRPIDFDNDGRSDFIAYDEETETWQLYRSLGDKFADPVTLPWNQEPGLFHHEVLVGERYEAVSVPWSAVADIDGDGVQDFLYLAKKTNATGRIKRGQLVLVPGKDRTANMLKAVTDGFGHRAEFTYSFDAYQPRSRQSLPDEPEALCWPSNCLNKMGRPLVATITEFSRRGETTQGDPTVGEFIKERSTDFTFEDGRVDGHGLGWVGFSRQTEVERDAAGEELETTTTHFDNLTYMAMGEFESFYPFAGYATRVETSSPRVDSGIAARGYRQRQTTVDFTWQTQLRNEEVPGGTLFPYLQTQTTVEYDANQPVAMAVTDNTVNSFGETDFTETTTYGFVGSTDEMGTLLHSDAEDVDYDYDKWAAWRADGIWRLPPVMRSTTTLEQPEDPSDAPGSITRTNEFGYAANGEVETVTREPDDTELYLKTEYHRTTLGLIDTVTTTDWHRNSRIGKVEEFDPDDVYPAKTTEAFGTDLARSNVLVHDARFGTLASSTDPNQLTSTWTYDDFGRLVETSRPDGSGATTRFDYATPATAAVTGSIATNGVFKTIQCSRGGGRSVEEIDSLGRVVRVKSIGLPDEVTDDLGEEPECEDTDEGDYVFNEFAYDEAGRLERSTRPHAGTDTTQGSVRRHYNAAGELIQVDMPSQNGGVDQVTYDLADARSASDALPIAPSLWSGKVLRFKDARNHYSYSAADVLGRRLATFSPTAGQVTYAHDPAGNLWRATDDLGDTWTAEHDTTGRERSVSDPNKGVHGYTYNAFDEMTLHTLPNGEEQRFTYDLLGRQTRSLSTRDGKRCWSYDQGANAIDRLSSRTAGSACPAEPSDPIDLESPDENSVSYEYDSQGRLSRETYQVDQGSPHERSLAFPYGYTDSGDLATIDYPAAGDFAPRVEYLYAARSGALVTARDADAPATTYWRLTSTAQHYQTTGQELGDHVKVQSNRYATTGHLEQLLTEAKGETIADNRYSYDANGNLESREDLIRDGSHEEFDYDEGDRLLHAYDAAHDVTLALTYYTNGNIRTRSGVGTFKYEDPLGDGRFRAHAVSSAGDLEIQHDDLGNQAFRNLGATTQDITYTHFGLPRQIDQITATEEKHVAFEYDANGVQLARAELDAQGDVISKRIYAGDLYDVTWFANSAQEEHVFKLVAAGTQIAQFEVTTGAGEIAAGPSLLYLHGDGLGSTELVTNAAGDVQRHQVWSAFGEATTLLAGANNVRAGYTGHEQEDDIGLVNMGGRFFDAKLGRFLSPDPLFLDDSADSLNAYSYVLNNPLTFSDPTGFDAPKKAPPKPPKDLSKLWAACQGHMSSPKCAPLIKQFGQNPEWGISTTKPKKASAPARDPATPGAGSQGGPGDAGGDAKGDNTDDGGGGTDQPKEEARKDGASPKGPDHPLTDIPKNQGVDPEKERKARAQRDESIMEKVLGRLAMWQTEGPRNPGGIPEGWCTKNCVSGTLVQMARIGLEFIGRGSGGIKTIIKNVAKKTSETIAEKAAEGIARGTNAFRRLARAGGRAWDQATKRWRDPATGRFTKGPAFPGNDPSKAPSGFEWRGKPGSGPGSKEGNYYNPNTGETLRPDLNHADPIGPHWDYRDSGGNWYCIKPNGSVEAK